MAYAWNRSWNRVLILSAAVVGAVTVMAVTYAALDSDSQEPEPLSPGAAQKATEAARPTPTAVPAAVECPADAVVCEVAGEMLGRGRQGDVTSMLAPARPVQLTCPPNPSEAMRPLCIGGEDKAGFFTGVAFKSFRFVGQQDFGRFLAAMVGGQPASPMTLASIGCPGEDPVGRSCDNFFAIAYRIELQPGAEGAMVLIFSRDEGGEPYLIGARNWSPGSVLRGGPEDMTQEGLPFAGSMYFIPWGP